MNRKKITCIVCPIGYKILVDSDGSKIETLNGYKCKRGVEYATSEALNPSRMLTTSILVKKGKWPLVSVKSSKPVPKEKIFQILSEIRKNPVLAPIEIGDVLIRNILNTNIDIIATKNVEKI